MFSGWSVVWTHGESKVPLPMYSITSAGADAETNAALTDASGHWRLHCITCYSHIKHYITVYVLHTNSQTKTSSTLTHTSNELKHHRKLESTGGKHLFYISSAEACWASKAVCILLDSVILQRIKPVKTQQACELLWTVLVLFSYRLSDNCERTVSLRNNNSPGNGFLGHFHNIRDKSSCK